MTQHFCHECGAPQLPETLADLEFDEFFDEIHDDYVEHELGHEILKRELGFKFCPACQKRL